MRIKCGNLSVMLCAGFIFSNAVLADPLLIAPKYDEAVLKKRYEEFISTLDVPAVAKDYPKVVKDILSSELNLQNTALQTFAETSDLRTIPWMVPFLDGEESALRISAGSAIEKIVSTRALRRRDLSRPDQVVLKPLADGELDLRPLAWIALKMFRKPDDGNTQAYAASITRYIEFKEFSDELKSCLRSEHPAVRQKAQWALESLGLSVDPETHSKDDGAKANSFMEKIRNFVTPQTAEQAQTLQLSIKSERQEYRVGDQITLNLALANKGEQEIWRDDFFANVDHLGHLSHFRFRVFKDHSNVEQAYIHREQVEDLGFKLSLQKMTIGETEDFTVNINEWYRISEPGTYTITATYSNDNSIQQQISPPHWRGTINSNTIIIKITKK